VYFLIKIKKCVTFVIERSKLEIVFPEVPIKLSVFLSLFIVIFGGLIESHHLAGSITFSP